MGKTRRKYTKEFKLSVIRELGSGVSVSEISSKYNIHPALQGRWKNEYYEDPENSFSGNGNKYKLEARNTELERLLGQLHAENEFLKKGYLKYGEIQAGGEKAGQKEVAFMTIQEMRSDSDAISVKRAAKFSMFLE